jgi:carbonic anhydrase/acetyltransferase-like protein (isoleucine patch superfamily)
MTDSNVLANNARKSGIRMNDCSILNIRSLANIYGCNIGDGSLIGIGSVVLNGAKIGKNCIIGSKALVTEGMEIPDGAMVLGVPGKVKKMLNDEEQSVVSLGAAHYIENYKKYKELTPQNDDSRN